VIPQVRAAVAGMPPCNAARPYLFRLQLAGELITQATATPRFRSGIGTLFAAIALLLAAIGVYGVQAHAVTRRTREIGIRMAVGANRTSVLLLILRESASWTVLGIAMGLAACAILTRFLAALLFGVPRWDPVTLVLASLLILAVSLLAAAFPARRAMSVDPVESLRAE
jgi:ABC-type antimicrobial peptide transport system permease subunit